MELISIFRSNPITGGLALQTVSELWYRGASEHNLGMIALDTVSALGVAGVALAGLPELGINPTNELLLYAGAIGFNLPTVVSVLTGNERFQDTSFMLGAAGAGLGLAVDALHVPINANALAKTILNSIGNLGRMIQSL